MNPVNATALYVSASRSVLQCDPRDPRSLAELCKLLPFFRQSLSCLVCGNLLQDPIAPTDSSCQHYVCRGCKGQRMQLKPSCSWCKDYSRFEENRQLSLLVHCYRKLCLYITQSPLASHIASAAGDSPDLQAILNEGVVLAESGESGLCDISTVGDDLKHGGGPMLLSVEEVLRTLDTDAKPDPTLEPDPQPDCPSSVPQSVPQSVHNGPHCASGPDSSRLMPSLPPESCGVSPPSVQLPLQPSTVAPSLPHRCHRKRSHSESDREKVQPLPISSFLRGPPVCTNSSTHHPITGVTTVKQEPKFVTTSPLHHLAPVPNGGPPKVGKAVLVSNKVGKAVLVSNKVLKKTVEHHGVAKKAYTKARQGAPKPRAQPRVPPHPHPLTHPPSPSKPLYKKPVEKKGCKCGRATQNPSVLTCRGQRCPCYSNRKACLDCICRGCQNSYMANGEKKLEAFAVPEKALEQTRLTLGINLTSIAAAALRGPATSSPAGTLLNVTTATGSPVTAAFLSGAGHDNRGFDDSLEMRFDC
uniref:E3 ubiquitin-protein ligase MSL2 n=1 Tax=Cynoglossus semilaevis TaxID=244447 RepID=A0A3P8UEQ8_CYNSE